MKISSLFFLIIITKISFLFSSEEQFNPLKPGNGILNQPYNHTSKEKNLFFIFLNIRHGARSPLALLDKHKDLLGGKWNVKSDLTSLGIRQHYKKKKKNMERYSSFIKQEYDPKEIKVYSTPFPRTIMSAASELFGFYNNNIYNDNFNYSDIDLTEKDIMDINNRIIPPVQLFSYDKKTNEFERIFKNHFNCKYMRNQVKLNW